MLHLYYTFRKLSCGTIELPFRRPIFCINLSFFINSPIVRYISQYLVDATVQVKFKTQHAKNTAIIKTVKDAEMKNVILKTFDRHS